MNSQRLKIFCDYYGVPFPKFRIETNGEKLFSCKTYSNAGVLLYQTTFHILENNAYIDAINLFYSHCLIEKNFLYLIEEMTDTILKMDIDA